MDDFYSARAGNKPPHTTAALVELVLRKLDDLEQAGTFQGAFSPFQDSRGEIHPARIPNPEQYVITHLARPGLFQWLGHLKQVVAEERFPNWDENTLFDVVELYYSVIAPTPAASPVNSPPASPLSDGRRRFRASLNEALSLRKPPLALGADGKIVAAPVQVSQLPPPSPDKLPAEHTPDAYDVFISYASEDKKAVALPLAKALRDRGHAVFFDEFELAVGDNLTSRIDAALAQSRRVVVILSPAFFAKRWPKRELDSLTTRELTSGENLLIPIWEGVNAEDVRRYSAALANRLAISSAAGLDAMVAAVERALQRGAESEEPRAANPGPVRKPRATPRFTVPLRPTMRWLKRPPGPIATLVILIIAGVIVFNLTTKPAPSANNLSKSSAAIKAPARPNILPNSVVLIKGDVVFRKNHRIGLIFRGLWPSHTAVAIRVRCLSCQSQRAHGYIPVSALIGEFLPVHSELDVVMSSRGMVGRYLVFEDTGSALVRLRTQCLVPADAQVPACAPKLSATRSSPRVELAGTGAGKSPDRGETTAPVPTTATRSIPTTTTSQSTTTTQKEEPILRGKKRRAGARTVE